MFYGLSIELAKVPALLVTFLVRVGTFAALGVAVAALVPNPQAATAVANATLLPLAFVSDVPIAMRQPPRWLQLVGDFFPLKPFAVGLQRGLSPTIPDPRFDWPGLAWMTLWTVVGIGVARFTSVGIRAAPPADHIDLNHNTFRQTPSRLHRSRSKRLIGFQRGTGLGVGPSWVCRRRAGL